ncbi:MAG: porin family protein [Catalinimonas sp.]
MKKIFLTTLAAMAFVVTAQAQIEFGPKVGLNVSNLRYDFDDDEPDSELLLGPAFGVVLNAQIIDLIAIQPALMYSAKGDRNVQDLGAAGEIETRTRINYLEVPINVVLGFGDPSASQFQIFAGPYAAFAIGGNTTVEGSTTVPAVDADLNFGSDNDDDFRGGDYGVNFGVGFRGSLFQAQAGYSLGLTNITAGNDFRDEFGVRTGVIHASVALLFGGD